MPKMEGEEAFELLEQMFEGTHLEEYQEAFDVIKEDWERICKDNRQLREQEIAIFGYVILAARASHLSSSVEEKLVSAMRQAMKDHHPSDARNTYIEAAGKVVA